MGGTSQNVCEMFPDRITQTDLHFVDICHCPVERISQGDRCRSQGISRIG